MLLRRLYKKQKLCSTLAIDALFGKSADSYSALAYPIRAAFRANPKRSSDAPLQFLISVPKKRLRHAVDRVKMRRRIREAFRLHQHLCVMQPGSRIDVAFVYVASDLQPYAKVERAMLKLLNAIAEKFPVQEV